MSGIDPANLAAWFDAHAAAMVLYARNWLDAAGAEDVVQDVFIRLMALPQPPASVKAWLYVATRNAAIGAARSSPRRQRRERTIAGLAGERLFERDPADPIDAADAEAALARLPP